MRLKQSTTDLIMDNIHLHSYCKEAGIDIDKLKHCYVERIGDNDYFFLLDKEDVPKSTKLIPLDYDIETQPDIVLKIDMSDAIPKFMTASGTSRIARDQGK